MSSGGATFCASGELVRAVRLSSRGVQRTVAVATGGADMGKSAGALFFARVRVSVRANLIRSL
jgi:hypothetical protein